MNFYINNKTQAFININDDSLTLQTYSAFTTEITPQLAFKRLNTSGTIQDSTSMYLFWNSSRYDFRFENLEKDAEFLWMIGGQHQMRLGANGNLYLYGGSTFNPSDFRVEDNIRDYATDINSFKNIKIRKYERTDNDVKDELGVIAQELKEVLPECVNINTSMDGKIDDFHYIDTNKIIMNTVSVVQQLIKRIEILEAKIENKI